MTREGLECAEITYQNRNMNSSPMCWRADQIVNTSLLHFLNWNMSKIKPNQILSAAKMNQTLLLYIL